MKIFVARCPVNRKQLDIAYYFLVLGIHSLTPSQTGTRVHLNCKAATIRIL